MKTRYKYDFAIIKKKKEKLKNQTRISKTYVKWFGRISDVDFAEASRNVETSEGHGRSESKYENSGPIL